MPTDNRSGRAVCGSWSPGARCLHRTRRANVNTNNPDVPGKHQDQDTTKLLGTARSGQKVRRFLGDRPRSQITVSKDYKAKAAARRLASDAQQLRLKGRKQKKKRSYLTPEMEARLAEIRTMRRTPERSAFYSLKFHQRYEELKDVELVAAAALKDAPGGPGGPPRRLTDVDARRRAVACC